MRPTLLVALFLTPLAASSTFSAFEISPWLVCALAIGTAAMGAWRHSWEGFLQGRPLLSWLTPALLLLGATSLMSSWSTDPASALIDLSRLALPILLVILVAYFWRGQSKSAALWVGASLPLFLLLAQKLLDQGWWPVAVAHTEGLWTSTLGNSALLGESVLVLSGFLVLLLRHCQGKLAVLFGLLFGIPTVVLLYFSDSRGVWLGATTCLAVLLFLEITSARAKGEKKKRSMATLAIVAALILSFIGVAILAPKASLQANFKSRVASIFDSSHPTNIVRRELAKDAWALTADHPVIGIGGGRFGAEHNRVRGQVEWSLSGLQSRVDDPHNEYLRILCEYGVLGAGLLLLGLAGLFVTLWRRRSCAVARLTLASWSGILVVAATWATFQHVATTIPLAFLTGLALVKHRGSEGPLLARKRTWRSVCALGLALISASVIVLWAERDSAAIALRDRGELLKKEYAAVASQDIKVSARHLADLGIVGKSITRVAASSWLRPHVRFRLLTTIYNLAEQRAVLETLSPAPDNLATTMLLNAARGLPSLQDARDLANTQLNMVPAHLPTIRLLGRLEALSGNKSAAVLRLESCLKINPDEPFARQLLAELYVEGKTQLYQNALEHLSKQIELWGHNAQASDASWQLKARCLGAQRHIKAALDCVDQWIKALGESDRRRAVGGELSLYLGETPDTVATFVTDPTTWGRRQERGSFTIAGFEGLPLAALRLKLLAHLGRHPHDTPVLDRLRDVIYDINQATGDKDAALERMRDRIIARSRVHYAWENHLSGDARNLRVCLRIARRKSPRQQDPYFIEVLHAATTGSLGAALMALRRWKDLGVDRFPALTQRQDLEAFCADPAAQAILNP